MLNNFNSPFYLLIQMNTIFIKSYNLCDNFLSKVQEILNKKKKRKQNLENALESLKNQLINYGASKIILFGSLNSGEIEVNSDLDLFVLMPATKSGKLWMNYIYENIERDIACDIIAYNTQEYEENKETSSFLSEILKTGKIIYEEKL